MEYDIVEDRHGNIYYHKKGTDIRHREDGPAYISADRKYKEWYREGKLHREDGPAVISTDFQSWFKDGEFHREDGPAIEYADGEKTYLIEGEELTEEEFNDRMKYDVVEEWGVIVFFKKGTRILHREDGPALICNKGSEFWFLNGKLHREDGPAVVYDNGSQFWYLNAEELTEEEFNERMKYDVEETEGEATYYFKKGTQILHREEGPAVIYPNGDKSWYINGELHREDGPAIDLEEGYKAWYINGLRHREDGPAVVREDEEDLHVAWYLEGEKLSEANFNERVKYDIVSDDIRESIYYKKGTKIRHREDGPAEIYYDGSESWYQDDKLHRLDGPAEIFDGCEHWYKEGVPHREDGPALMFDDGSKSWWLNGEQYTEEEFNDRMKYDIEKSQYGNIYYYKKGTQILHREDGPAYIHKTGYQSWYQDNKLHREDGPAVEYASGNKAWWIEGEELTEEEFNERQKYDVVTISGGVLYYKKGTKILHREDGPAIAYKYGHEEWYKNGKLHREDGPAVIAGDGSKYWYINDKYHREDGPALILHNGQKCWYLNGEKLTEAEFNERMGIANRSEYKITTGAFILEVDGEDLAFKTKQELVDYLTHKL